LTTAFKPGVPQVTALACAAIAACALLGWILGIGHLTSVFPGLPTMVPVTALLTLAGCAALWRLATHGSGSLLPAGLLTAAALVILQTHFTQLAPSPFVLRAGARPLGPWSLSSPVTAAMFAALGLGLLAMHRPRQVRYGQALALGVLLLGLLMLVGYVFRETFLYQLLPGKGTSLLTTMALILLAVGMLALRPADGIMVALAGSDPGAWIARRLLLSALVMPVLLGLAGGLLLQADAIDVGSAIAFLAWGMVVLFTAVVWRFALMLYRVEVARRQAERERQAALEALREADTNKDDFLALLAHELRNPLAPIRAAAELLRLPKAQDAAQLQRTSAIIGRQVDHMVHLVDDLLDISRVRRGLIRLDKAPVDLFAAVCEAIEQVRPQVAQRRHQLHTDLPHAHPGVTGDHKRLVQIVANLLGNAARYTPEGGNIRLALRTGADTVEVSVQDDGIGIDAALLPQVFDPFTQGQRGAAGGLGLGLALVRHLAELHEGRIEAHSDGPGSGSTFVLTLPRLPLPMGAGTAHTACDPDPPA